MLPKVISSLSFATAITLITCSALAQQFQPAICYQTGAPAAIPMGAVSADFNHDGAPDLAVANYNNGHTVILLNQGDGSFRTSFTFPTPSSTVSLAAGDLNGDGNVDLLAINSPVGTVGSLVVFLGTGNGKFTPAGAYKVGVEPTQAVVADFNGDGFLDVAVTNPKGGGVMVFPGNGLGNLGTPTSYRGTASPYALAAADVNGDGYQDLLVAGAQGSLAILRNNGDGTFTGAASYRIGQEADNIAVGDLNHDGKLDVAISVAFDQGIDVLLGNGDGTFGPVTFYSTASAGNAPDGVVFADFNLDGKVDLAISTAQGNLGLFYGNGDGTLQRLVKVTIAGGGCGALVTADFDKDGATDLAASIPGANRVGVLMNTQ
jgi:hypothetical protein